MLLKILNGFQYTLSIRPKSTTDFADIRIYDHREKKRKVIVICEPYNYDGMSVTNAMEDIIKSLIDSGHADPNDVFIEHYPESVYSGKEESFDIVRYNQGKVSWAPLSRDETEHLIGEHFQQ